MSLNLSARASALVASARGVVDRTIARARADYDEAEGLLGYVWIRLHDKASIAAIGGAIVAANALKPSYAVATIVVAIIGVLVPTP